MKYGIASYRRPECKTVDLLVALGVAPDDIYVSIQDEGELENYRRIHKDVNYIVEKADCAAGNRNSLIRRIERPFVLLDDDLKAFVVRRNGENFKRAENIKELELAFEDAIAEAKRNKCSLIGVSATDNNLMAKARPEYSYDTLLQGSVLIVVGNVGFNDKWKMVEDYELSLRLIYNGSHTLRANWISASKPKNGTNEGGLHERYENGELGMWISRLASKYKIFKPNKALTGGSIRF